MTAKTTSGERGRSGGRQRGESDLRVVAPRLEHVEDGLEVSFTARNAGDGPLYVQCGIRQVEWQPGERRVTLWFSDRGRSEELRHTTKPRTVILEAGEEKPVTAKLPRKLNRLIVLDGGGFDFEPIDLAEARSVRLVVGAAGKPFYYNPKGDSSLEQLKAWGSDSETTCKVTGSLPPGDGGSERPERPRRAETSDKSGKSGTGSR